MPSIDMPSSKSTALVASTQPPPANFPRCVSILNAISAQDQSWLFG
jgi:hypothetical protein